MRLQIRINFAAAGVMIGLIVGCCPNLLNVPSAYSPGWTSNEFSQFITAAENGKATGGTFSERLGTVIFSEIDHQAPVSDLEGRGANCKDLMCTFESVHVAYRNSTQHPRTGAIHIITYVVRLASDTIRDRSDIEVLVTESTHVRDKGGA